MSGKTTIGVDAGGTAIKGVLLRGEKVERSISIPSPKNGIEPFVEAIAQVARELRDGQEIPVGLGIASPYSHETGEILDPPNLPVKGRYPLKAEVERLLGCHVEVDNDANAAALGEWAMGAGRGSRVMLCLTLGTGIGGGMVIHGEVFRGAHGFGAEFGHINVDPCGPPCGCGSRGCLEAMASATALVRIYHKLKKGKGKTMPPKEIYLLAKENDHCAKKAFEEVGKALGRGLASLINALDPDTVVIGGGLSNAWDVLCEPVRAEMGSRLLTKYPQRVRLVPAELGTFGGAIGAACLVNVETSDNSFFEEGGIP